MAKIVIHEFQGKTTNHLPGSSVCDVHTLCGSFMDEGKFTRDVVGVVDCAACIDVVRTVNNSLSASEYKAMTK